jgi:hypothetical protein
MGKMKQLAEDAAKEAPAPMIDDKPKAPDKKAGPHAAAAGAQADIRAVEQAAITERARRMAALQRKVGNARLGRMLGGATKDVPPVEAEAETTEMGKHTETSE